MIPTVMIVTAGDDWMVVYFVSTISDKKVWEGHPVDTSVVESVSETFGYPVEYWTMTDEDEYDGSTPDTYAEIKGKIQH